jgi:two-component system response regulator AtoC
MDGMELLVRLRKAAPDLPVVMLTAHGTVELAVEAMREGAADFLRKPFDRDEVLHVVDKCLRLAAQDRSPEVALDEADGAAPEMPWLGDSEAMQAVAAVVARAAAAKSTVLIRGETGSGKEVVARALHRLSPRAGGPFVAVNCGGLPEALLESELFGHERGAFTGATHAKPGRVELAEGGTLLLDEIGDVSGAVQVKLLRLLQEREYSRLGGTVMKKADVRFVAATHRDLEAAVAEGRFREDLYYRLNVVPIFVPPLRERAADVAPLAERFLRLHREENGRPDLRFGPGALVALRAQPWPGNVRELSNFVERLVVFAEGDTIDAEAVEGHLDRAPKRPSSPDATPATQGTLEERRMQAERAWILEALAQTGDNRTQAARVLGISRRTLYNKLEELGLS